MQEEYITVNSYMKRFKLGYATVMNMIQTNQVEYVKTSNDKYRIKIGGDTVSRVLYEEEHKKRIEAENTLKNIMAILKSANVIE